MLVVSCRHASASEEAWASREASSEGLVVIAVGGPVPEHLTDFTVGALLAPTAVVCGVGGVLGHLCLGRTILCVMEIKAVTYVTEEARFLLGLFLLVITVIIVQVVPIPVKGCF